MKNAAFALLLFIYIGGGIAGLFSGAVAMSFRKGSRPHRVAGNIFFVSMLGMSAAGACLAFMKSETNNVFGGLLTFYLVATSWVTAGRGERETNAFDLGALLVASSLGAFILTYGVEAATSPIGEKRDFPLESIFSWLPWLFGFPRRETYACFGAAVSRARRVSCDTSGVCASRGSSPRHLCSSHGRGSSQP